METVKMSSAVQTKALVSPGGTKQVSKAENAGDFVKLLQEKGQTADAGGTQAAAGGDSGKNLKADTKEAKTRDEKTEDPLVDDILRQAGAQQAAAQITGILQEIPAVGGEDVIPELGTGGAESVTAGAGVTEIMSEVLGSGDSMPQVPQYVDIPESVFHLDVHHIMNKLLIRGAVAAADQQLEPLPVAVHIVDHPVYAVPGFLPHMGRLLLLGELGKVRLGCHEPAHDSRRAGLHQGGEQGLLAGVVAVKGPGGHSSGLDDIPQGGSLEALFQELSGGGLVNSFQSIAFVHRILRNSVI